ncbi:MAG: iron-sulfur cluster assembly scaffold protein [Anaerolineales bacterium]|nr:iron-sulfur cluster assembly scaffold protein [Anaerolineales bacterium]MDW8325370.1 iron-sulfur cluster assembly scaffold protein [Anaerolineales bacterium]
MPTRQESIDFILDHFENPRRRGRLENADLVLEGGNPGCGDVVTLYLKLDAETRIVDIGFEGEGCTISQAAASLLTEHVLGRTLREVAEMSPDPLVDELGRDVVSTRLKCATLALNTLKNAEKQYRNGQARAEVQAT